MIPLTVVGFALVAFGLLRDKCTPFAAFLCNLAAFLGFVFLFVAFCAANATGPMGSALRIH